MPLPTVAVLKDYLRIETSVEDGLLARLLQSAQAAVEQYLRRPITAAPRTFEDVPETWVWDGGVSALLVPAYPVASAGLVVTDTNGDAVASGDYRVDTRSGRVFAIGGRRFGVGPYVVTATVGLSAHPDYEHTIEPAINQAIFDICSDWYDRRSPHAQQEGAGGAYKGWSTLADLPARTKMLLDPWRMPPRL